MSFGDVVNRNKSMLNRLIDRGCVNKLVVIVDGIQATDRGPGRLLYSNMKISLPSMSASANAQDFNMESFFCPLCFANMPC
jgi:hypothetical protein